MLNTQYALDNEGKIDHTPKPWRLFQHVYMTEESSQIGIVALKFASDEAAEWKVEILELPLHWV